MIPTCLRTIFRYRYSVTIAGLLCGGVAAILPGCKASADYEQLRVHQEVILSRAAIKPFIKTCAPGFDDTFTVKSDILVIESISGQVFTNGGGPNATYDTDIHVVELGPPGTPPVTHMLHFRSKNGVIGATVKLHVTYGTQITVVFPHPESPNPDSKLTFWGYEMNQR